ncbi:uncharacterized protein MELLADRAFT_112686 [Melampsora larici-populina 98AG31]|uniref:Uncharacterized protein n=1 Tax=Melampsora larici-populina (strain 98AG31 / pathotype 3-4-7) TaxID=747676 RepID=F4S797_MELLP|nr:uncharacterized protein MELLADRAFT_112686 [Melampsora larici-populina 98AG31]EGF99477.1 hypothetical protein MELLADRAFT_112686 [Melampsora larici-populina 98AG31]
MSCLTPLLRSPSRSSLLPAELAQIHLNISQNLLREAQLLAQVDAIEAECQQAELEHRSILQEINSNLTDETISKFDTPISTISTIQVPSPLIPPLPSPMAPPLSSRGPVMIPVGESKELSPSASSLLRSLWAKIGYEGSAFSGMQVEISKELSRADFARFERQMLLIAAEDRTFKTLMSEREIAKNAIQSAQKGVEKIVLAKDKEVQKSKALNEELERLDQERISAFRYAKNAEEQAAIANLTAKAATAVAVSAVNSHPNTPRLSSYHNPNLTSSSWASPSASYAHSSSLASRSPYPNHSNIPSSSSYNTGVESGWSLDDEQKLIAKMKERKKEKMISEERRALNERMYSRLELEKLGANLPSVSRNPSPSSNQQYHHDHPPTPKKVDWNNPLIGSSSTTAKRY